MTRIREGRRSRRTSASDRLAGELAWLQEQHEQRRLPEPSHSPQQSSLMHTYSLASWKLGGMGMGMDLRK